MISPISPDSQDSLGREIRALEVRRMALRRELEELLRVERGRPLSFRVLREMGVVLRVVLWLTIIGSVVVILGYALLNSIPVKL